MLKSTLINSMVSFTLGTGVALASVMAYTGTTDLQAIKSSVQEYTVKTDTVVSDLLNEYNVVVDEANAEIGEYKVALQQANDNIFKLATAYEAEQAKYEQDLAELQTEYDEMTTRLEQQYEQDMNQIIEQANSEIQKANEEVSQAKDEVQQFIDGSNTDINSKLNEERSQLETGGDKTVTDVVLPDITPEEQATEQE